MLDGMPQIEVRQQVEATIVTINRPEKLNALTVEMLRDLGEVLRAEGTTGKGIVVTGAGRAFSAGDDLPATENLDEASFIALLEAFQDLTRAVLASRGPVVAAVNGIAVGGAAEFTLCCDVRLGCPETEYLFPENQIGLTISNGSSYLLPRLIGGHAIEFVLSGRRIGAEEANSLGLVSQLVERREELLPTAIGLLDRWTGDPLSTEYHLELLRPPIDEVEKAMGRENVIGNAAWSAGLPQEGISKFLKSRKSGD
jgi:enoyl-CoA hydratase/carnithine racemase